MEQQIWETVVQNDPEQPGEFIIELPEGLLNQVQWVEGDVLEWNVKDGVILLSKKG
jgi:hypothetical protein